MDCIDPRDMTSRRNPSNGHALETFGVDHDGLVGHKACFATGATISTLW